MGRVPKKHRQYTEAVDSNEMEKSAENKSETIDEVPAVEGEKEIEKSNSGNGKPDQDDDEEDFKSIHGSDSDNNDSKIDEDIADHEESDDEPLRKVSKIGKSLNKEKRLIDAPKKRGRKIVKKTPIANDEEYEVQDIVGHKVERGIDFYLVRWKGYTKNDDTWEPSTTLSCPALIQKFKNKQLLHKDKQKIKSAGGGNKTRKAKSSTKSQEDPDKQWEVEKIIDYAEEKNGRIFRIRWKGFSVKHDTWEPERNLSCDEVIAKFMQRIKSQEYVSFKELRVAPKKPKRLVNETAPPTSYHNAIGRKSKRATTKKRIFYGDSD